jgi:hypothetical protein
LSNLFKSIFFRYNIIKENIPRYSKKYSNVQQKGKKEGGWGEGIFALLRLEIERFRFSLIKRKPKQKIFHLLLKEKNGGQKKIKNVMKKFLFWFAVAERRQVETHRLNYHALRAYDLVQSHHARGACVSRGSVQKKLEFQPKGTANLQFQISFHTCLPEYSPWCQGEYSGKSLPLRIL